MLFGFAFIAASLAQLPAASPGQSRELPLVVDRAHLVDDGDSSGRSPLVSVTIRNIGQRTVVGWGFRAEVRFSDGTSKSSTTTTDGYESLGLEMWNSVVLAPGATHTSQSWGPGPRRDPWVVGVSAEPILVIFDDDTARGDESHIEFLFQQRALNHRTWPIVEKALAQASAAATDPLDILTLFQRRAGSDRG